MELQPFSGRARLARFRRPGVSDLACPWQRMECDDLPTRSRGTPISAYALVWLVGMPFFTFPA